MLVFVFVFGACIRWSLGGDRGMRDKNLKRGPRRETRNENERKGKGGGEGKEKVKAE